MKEIEVKARLRDPKSFVAKLTEKGIGLSKPIKQRDIIFTKDLERFTEFVSGADILRIREQDEIILFTLKRSLANELDSLEYEVTINSVKEMRNILEMLGFKEAIRVNKIRRKAKTNGYEVCIDEVETLGTFVEVEKLTDDETDSEVVQAELFAFLEQFGVTHTDQVTQGYDTMMALATKKRSSSSSH